MNKIHEKILLIIQTAERPLTITDIKKELQYRAVKEAYGLSSFTAGDLRDSVMHLINEGKVESKEVEASFKAYQIKDGDEETS